jgi:predicted O-methyltransferase YrrM
MDTEIEKYIFTQDWFDKYKPYFSTILNAIKPTNILEIGSFEGRSTVFIATESLKWNKVEVTSIDSWSGGQEHSGIDFSTIEKNFDSNIATLKQENDYFKHIKIKGKTKDELPKLVVDKRKYDLIYVDGSHEPKDVLYDLCLAYELLKRGGVMIADDYKWSPALPGTEDLLRMPKIAIDAFITCNFRDIELIEFPINQIYFRKR